MGKFIKAMNFITELESVKDQMQKLGSKIISSTVKLKVLSNILDIAEEMINK